MIWELTDVKIVPGFTHNLISVAKLTQDPNIHVQFSGDECNVFYHNEPIITATRRDSDLYIVRVADPLSSQPSINHTPTSHETAYPALEPTQDTISYIKSHPMSILHQRLGHLSWTSINHMSQVNAVNGLDKHEVSKYVSKLVGSHLLDEGKVCDACALSKMHRNKFSSTTKRPPAKQVLERIHADVCGPFTAFTPEQRNKMNPVLNNIGEPIYLSVIVDEYSRYIHCRPIVHKSAATEHVMSFIKEAEKLTGKPVKCLVSDGGGEYSSKDLAHFLNNNGITHEFTTINTPQHNAHAERIIRAIVELTRAMLFHANLGLHFWKYAAMTAVYILNKRAIPSHDGSFEDYSKTPHELYTNNGKPNISHLKVFGCDSYAHISQGATGILRKLDPRAAKCIFLGYSYMYRDGYIFYDIQRHKLIYRRDATFYEDQFTCGRDSEVFTFGAINSTESKSQNIYINKSNVNHSQSDKSNLNSQQSEYFNQYNSQRIRHSSEPSLESPVVNESNNKRHSHSNVKESNIQSTQESSNIDNMDERLDRSQSSSTSTSSQKLQSVNESSNDQTSTIHHSTSAANESSSAHTNESSIHMPPDEEMSSLAHPHSSYHSLQASTLNIPEDPFTYEEAINAPDREHWIKAMQEEMDALQQHQTWKLVSLPVNSHAIGCKWVFKKKLKADGTIERYKARLVAKGFSQVEGIDYHDTFAPVIKYKAERLLLAIATSLDYEVDQMDVVTAFLNGEMKEDVYMRQPQGFTQSDTMLVCKLIKTLYGTKQAPREWNDALNNHLVNQLHMKRCLSDTCVYVKKSATNRFILIGVFVDDMLCVYSPLDKQEWLQMKKTIQGTFNIKDLGPVNWILGMHVTRDRQARTLSIDLERYIEKVLSKFNLSSCNPCFTPEEKVKLTKDMCPSTPEAQQEMSSKPYRSAVGSVAYAGYCCRPDIVHATNEVSAYLENPGMPHWNAVKRIMRYLAGTKDMKLTYQGTKYSPSQATNTTMSSYEPHIEVFVDADWGGNLDTRRSTTGYLVKLDGNTISWSVKRQPTVAASTCEAEYMALANATSEVLWLRQLLGEITNKQADSFPPSTLRTDNEAARQLTHNDQFHNKSKHIDIKYHFIRERLQAKVIQVTRVPTQDQQADIFTKALDKPTFSRLSKLVMDATQQDTPNQTN